MATMLDIDISGDGQEPLSGSQPVFVLVWLFALGPGVRDGDPGSDQIIRAGWFTLGSDWDLIMGSTADYWRPPIYLNFIRTFWQPDPAIVNGTDQLTIYATRLKWHLSAGTNGHIYVGGN
jgi:hypothetical protein